VALAGTLNDRVEKWCLEARGFIYGHVYGTPAELPAEQDERDLLDDWSRETVNEVLDSYLAVLKNVKDAIPPTRLG